MNTTILAIILFLFMGFSLYKLYRPKIEIIEFAGSYEIYLWYNKYNEEGHIERIKKYLLTIQMK